MRSLVLGFALVSTIIVSPVLAGVKEGAEAWRDGNYPKAVAEWRGPAEAGEPDAQFNLGQAYKLGRGVQMDATLAQDWYRKAAAAGHEQAQATLGLLLFQNGKREEAMTWLKKAADQGEPRAQYVVGTAYFNGDLLPKDWARAYALMLRAKSNNIGAATTSLAQMEQLIPDQQRQAGIALAREMERTAQLRANDVGSGDTAALTMRNSVAPPPTAQASAPPIARTSVPPSKAELPTVYGQPVAPPPVGAAPILADSQPWRAPASIPAGSSAPTAAPASTAVTTTPKPAVQKPAAPKPVIVASAGDGWKIQIGAYSSADAARAAWSSLSARAGLKALSPTYTPVSALTRLQAGPLASRAAANEACAAVKAVGATCFAVAP